MTQAEIEQFIETLDQVERDENMGYIFYFVGNYRMIPFVSIANSDNEYDKVSRLDREGVFRVNIGVSKKTFEALFGNSNTEDKPDYSKFDVFMPHPDYAKQFFICILNPSENNSEKLKALILEAHAIGKKKLPKSNA
jgi:hypothetical protein